MSAQYMEGEHSLQASVSPVGSTKEILNKITLLHNRPFFTKYNKTSSNITSYLWLEIKVLLVTSNCTLLLPLLHWKHLALRSW